MQRTPPACPHGTPVHISQPDCCRTPPEGPSAEPLDPRIRAMTDHIGRGTYREKAER